MFHVCAGGIEVGAGVAVSRGVFFPFFFFFFIISLTPFSPKSTKNEIWGLQKIQNWKSGEEEKVPAWDRQELEYIVKVCVCVHDSKIHLLLKMIYFPPVSCSKIDQYIINQQILPLIFKCKKKVLIYIHKEAGITRVHTCTHLYMHPDSDLNYTSANCTVSNEVITG